MKEGALKIHYFGGRQTLGDLKEFLDLEHSIGIPVSLLCWRRSTWNLNGFLMELTGCSEFL